MDPYRQPAPPKKELCHAVPYKYACPLVGLSKETRLATLPVGGCVCNSCWRNEDLLPERNKRPGG